MPDTIMNEKEYFSIMTQAGSIYMADAAAEERLVNPKYIAVGDAGGIPYQPNVFMTGLKNQCWIGEIIEKVKDADNPDIVEFRTVLPSDVGGFTVREVAVITDDGTTLFLANHPDAMKVLSSSGASNEFPINIRCLFTSAENVDMQVDPNVAVASRQWVENRLVQEFEAHNGDPDAHPGIQAGIQDKIKQHNDDGDAHPAINSKITELAGDGINAHNTDATAHVAIREKIGTDIAAHNAAADTHQDIRTSLGNVYTKAETDSALASKANTAEVYSKAEVDGKVAGAIAPTSNRYANIYVVESQINVTVNNFSVTVSRSANIVILTGHAGYTLSGQVIPGTNYRFAIRTDIAYPAIAAGMGGSTYALTISSSDQFVNWNGYLHAFQGVFYYHFYLSSLASAGISSNPVVLFSTSYITND